MTYSALFDCVNISSVSVGRHCVCCAGMEMCASVLLCRQKYAMLLIGYTSVMVHLTKGLHFPQDIFDKIDIVWQEKQTKKTHKKPPKKHVSCSDYYTVLEKVFLKIGLKMSQSGTLSFAFCHSALLLCSCCMLQWKVGKLITEK